jgi:hypothetical protein
MALEESDAYKIARDYIEQNAESFEEYLSEYDLSHPKNIFLSGTDPSNYYPVSRAVWVVSFWCSVLDEWGDGNGGWPPPQIAICVDAETGEVWRYTTPKKSSQQQRAARKERRAAKKNRQIES